MSVKVTLATPLTDYTEGRGMLHLEAATVREALQRLCADFPALGALLWRGGEFNPVLVVFRNDEDIRHLQGLSTPISPHDELSIITAVEGG